MSRSTSQRALGLFLSVVTLVCASTGRAWGHNGELALAYPIDGIAVDGDLADWPEDLPSQPIAKGFPVYGETAEDSSDCVARFWTAYSAEENALYLAVQVEDESVVIGPGDAGAEGASVHWEMRDGVEIYLSLTHGDPDSLPVQYALRGETLHRYFGEHGPRWGNIGEEAVWDDARMAWRRTDELHQYEIALDVDRITDGALSLRPGVVVALDVAVVDADADGSSTWVTWGDGEAKFANLAHTGDVALVRADPEADALLGVLRQVLREDIEGLRAILGAQTRSDAFLVGVPLAFSMLHLLLYAFRPSQVANLHYGLFLAVLFVVAFSIAREGTIIGLVLGGDSYLVFSVATYVAMYLTGLRFLYSLFYPRVSRGFWVVLSLAVVSLILFAWVATLGPGLSDDPGIAGWLLALAALATVADSLRVLAVAVYRRRDGARIIAAGYVLFMVSAGPAPVDLRFMGLTPVLGVLVFLAIMSARLAWSVAQTGRALDAQLAEVRQLSETTQQQNDQLEAANAQVHEATRNKSEFLRRMSHDLRSPMNAIIGYTRLVLRKSRGALDERQIHNLENIQTSSERLLDLINDILDLSRIEAGRIELQMRETQLQPLVSECVDALAPLVKPGVELVRQIETTPPIETDPDRFRQVVMNLLGNAVKFTDEGSITVSLRTTDGGVELCVADTGVGIPPEDLPHIFDEFRQVERQGGEQTEGTGLGLSIARKIVELLGGEISAQSEVGKGTAFAVRLPG